MNRLRSIWDRLNPRQQRLLIIVGMLLGALIIFWILALMVPEPRKLGERKTVVKHLLTDSDPRSLGIEGLATEIRQMGQRNGDLLRRMENLEAQEKLNRSSTEEWQRRNGGGGDTETRAELEAIKGQLEVLQKNPMISGQGHAPSGNNSDPILPPTPGSTSRTKPVDTLFNRTMTGTGPTGKSTGEIRIIRGDLNESGKTEGADLKNSSGARASASEKSEAEVFIPAGTLLSGYLLNGLDAPTGKKARKEPFPVLARIKQEAILPNRFRADLRECFLIASGYGDLSAERAYIRAETLSCVRQDGGVIEVPIDAYAVGEDGKLGLRGNIVSKQGQLMANSLLAGFAKGFSDAFGRVQVPFLLSGSPGSMGGSVPYQSAFSGQAVEGGALKGAGYSMDRMAHYYMDLAENLFPVVEIDATRQIEFVVQRGTPLKLYDPKATHRPNPSSPQRY